MQFIKGVLFYFIAISCFTIVSSAQLINTPQGDYEFIGLTSWTPQNILDTLSIIDKPQSTSSLFSKKLADTLFGSKPSKPIHICAADLRFKLGFADASVEMDMEGERQYKLITVLERKFIDYVHYKPEFVDTSKNIDDWKEIIQIYEKHPMEFQVGIINYGYILKKQRDTAFAHLPDWVDTNIVKQLWAVLQKKNKSEEKYRAVRVLNSDGNYKNRISAVTILSNFYNNDSTWWILVDVLRDSDARVSSLTQQTLQCLPRDSSKQINWLPISNSIKYILDGTNLFMFKPMVNLLVDTRVSLTLARPLLKNGTNIILAYLKANRLKDKECVHKLLIQLSGKDYGFDVTKWSNWINSL